jgi:Flp pilus assembly protein TadB
MNHLDRTGRIPEFGRTHNTGRRRTAMATIAALCAVAFAYDAFSVVAHVLNITALVIAVIAAIIVLIWLRRTIRNSHRKVEIGRIHRHTGDRS